MLGLGVSSAVVKLCGREVELVVSRLGSYAGCSVSFLKKGDMMMGVLCG